jgi:hypothetical protein
MAKYLPTASLFTIFRVKDFTTFRSGKHSCKVNSHATLGHRAYATEAEFISIAKSCVNNRSEVQFIYKIRLLSAKLKDGFTVTSIAVNSNSSLIN